MSSPKTMRHRRIASSWFPSRSAARAAAARCKADGTKYEIYADNLLAECHIRATQPLASCGPWLGSRVSCPGRQDGKRPSNRPT